MVLSGSTALRCERGIWVDVGPATVRARKRHVGIAMILALTLMVIAAVAARMFH